ncbi:hypothetical protein Tco_0347269 [Tanacetum coccineum]
MPSELPLINELFNIKVGVEKLSLLIHQNSKRESIFYTSKAEIERNDFCREKVKNQLLNELRNKDLHDEIERISTESNDVSFEVTQGLSKRIVELEKDLSKSKKKLKSQLFEFAETKFKNILEKIEFFKKKQLDISELNMESGENVCDNAKYHSEAQPTPSPAPTSEVPNEPQTASSPAQTSEVHIEQQTDLSPRPSPTPIIPESVPETYLVESRRIQAKEIQLLKAQITKLKKQAKLVIKHHRAWLKSVSLKQRLPSKSFSKKHKVHKESVSKQGRKVAKGTREMVDEDKEIDEIRLSTEDVLSTDKEVVSTDKEVVSTDKEKVSTDRPIVSTDGSKISTDRQIEGTDEQIEGTDEHIEGTEEHNEGAEEQREGTEEKVESTDGQRKGTEDQTEEEIAAQATQTPTQTHTSTVFGDDETIAKVLLNMSQAKAISREKEKGEVGKILKEPDRPRTYLYKINPDTKALPKMILKR